jgi:hypothetical protein
VEAHKATLDPTDHRGGLRRARLARAPQRGTQGASRLVRAIITGRGPTVVAALLSVNAASTVAAL